MDIARAHGHDASSCYHQVDAIDDQEKHDEAAGICDSNPHDMQSGIIASFALAHL